MVCTTTTLVSMLLVWLVAAHLPRVVSQTDDASCARIVTEYFARQIPVTATRNPQDHVIFFLHVPRTAGRTYNTCFLKQAFPPSQRCARSYDLLRYNISLPSCKLLTSHDDFSIVQLLPPDAEVITQLRDPLDRILSAYEFANEVAVRGVNKPRTYPQPPTVKPGRTDTRNVWPWSHLVMWTQDILNKKATAANATFHNVTALDVLDPYNNILTMPLREFIDHPNVHETLHNGATLQVLGITNYSIDPAAGLVRGCFWANKASREQLLQFALQRVRNFTHVGTTDRLMDSMASLAATLHVSIFGPSWKPGAVGGVEYKVGDKEVLAPPGQGLPPEEVTRLTRELNLKRVQFGILKQKLRSVVGAGEREEEESERMRRVEQRLRRSMAALKVEGDVLAQQLGVNWDGIYLGRATQLKPDNDFTTGKPLWRAFRECEGKTGGKQAKSKGHAFMKHTLPGGESFVYGKDKRQKIPEDILQRIRDLNSADMVLHQEALKLLEHHLARMRKAGRLEDLPALESQPQRQWQGQLQGQGGQPRKGQPQVPALPTRRRRKLDR